MSIFVPTGERRPPRMGELYKNEQGRISMAYSDHYPEAIPQEIYKEVTEEEHLASLWKDPKKEPPKKDGEYICLRKEPSLSGEGSFTVREVCYFSSGCQDFLKQQWEPRIALRVIAWMPIPEFKGFVEAQP